MAAVEPSSRTTLVKTAILEAAHDLFTTRGYERTGVRDIAAAAGVNPAIVIRHFGSKERLFLVAVDVEASWRSLLGSPLAELGRNTVRAVLRARTSGGHLFGELVRASGRSDVRARLRSVIPEYFATPLVDRLAGARPELRAHLFASQLTGFMCALNVYDDPVIAAADEGELIDLVGDALQRILDGEPALP